MLLCFLVDLHRRRWIFALLDYLRQGQFGGLNGNFFELVHVLALEIFRLETDSIHSRSNYLRSKLGGRLDPFMDFLDDLLAQGRRCVRYRNFAGLVRVHVVDGGLKFVDGVEALGVL